MLNNDYINRDSDPKDLKDSFKENYSEENYSIVSKSFSSVNH